MVKAMAAQKQLEDIKQVIQLTTQTIPYCHICEGEKDNRSLFDFDYAINHYIESHGYKPLHLGPETIIDKEGNILNRTTAILGI